MARPASSWRIPLLVAPLLLSACAGSAEESDALFTLLPERQTRVSFVNRIEDEPEFNILEYLYFYDGGGVAIGDIDNDSLPDIFLTGNQVSNRLYLNRGQLRFEDITEKAGVGAEASHWSTGVTMADVDGDGWLDIYVCQVHHLNKDGHNLLYINNRDRTFTERSQEYGLDFEGLSTQAAFFDYDRDGDLDLYLLNHAIHTKDSYVRSWRRIIDAPRVGDRLYRNDAGLFRNVTSEAGIFSSTLGYGLGLAICDINNDGWPDIYVGNDFHENDYLYFNNGDGSFSQALQRVIGHTSQSTMGLDIADFNNDGLVDIVALDMSPEDLPTYRASRGADADDVAKIKRDLGYAPQSARNTLQMHRGMDPAGYPLFSEIGVFAGIHATDWSWSALFTDLDNDGWKDLFVTNGIPGRPNDLDYSDYVSRPDIQRILHEGSLQEQLAVTKRMPTVEISNYAFRNNGDATFSDHAVVWGLDAKGFSNGAAYGDLDNDGDVDLVVNNINRPAFVYRNNGAGHYLTVKLEGEGLNTTGIGAKVLLYTGQTRLYQEQSPTRGFQSSVPHTLYFGLGASQGADSLDVVWADGQTQRLRDIEGDRRLILRQRDAHEAPQKLEKVRTLFQEITSEFGTNFAHRENDYEDFTTQPLLPHRLSTQGPALAVADVNGDGLDDIYIGGAHAQASALLLQVRAGGSVQGSADAFAAHRDREDVDAAFFDADGDGDKDLYVVSGGGQAPAQDRLYVNDGHGRFRHAPELLPDILADGCCVAPADFDRDGDIDLFVGARSVPGAYGASPGSKLLENDGAGRFLDITQAAAPSLGSAGMITDALWADVTGNSDPDLVLVGEWMPVTILLNAEGVFTSVTAELGLAASGGWWNSVIADDFDGDGDMDLVAGNRGANSVLQPPLELIAFDFDGDATLDPIVATPYDGRLFTWARRDALLKQIPGLAPILSSHRAYAELGVESLFDAEAVERAERKRIDTSESLYLENNGEDGFSLRPLPREAQWSPIMSMAARDFDGDGRLDLLTAGNFLGANSVQGRYDADYGMVLLGNGQGSFEARSSPETGFFFRGEARGMHILRMPDNARAIIVARNGDTLQLFRFVER